MRKKKIMVVDDEDSIRMSIAGILKDEGYRVVLARDGNRAMKKLATTSIDLVLLDIWMPGMDGTEVLKEIKIRWPDVRVIMISGHGNIETAVKTTKLGAHDYIEKPLSLEGVLFAVRRALHEDDISKVRHQTESEKNKDVAVTQADKINGGVRADTNGATIPQKTIKRSIVLGGQGLHSGMQTGLIFSPLPPDSGVIFTELSSEDMIPAHLDYVHSTDYATTIKLGHTSIMTIEHLMAVLHMYKITNVLIKTSSEIPILDGSAIQFCQMIEDAGIEEQDRDIDEIIIGDFHLVGDINDRYISIGASDDLIVQYSLDNPGPIGKQEVRFIIDDVEVFKKEIAPARTYGFVKDYERMEEMGLAKGGRLSNLILLDEEKAINTALRFEDEFARHKVLDILGDLYLLGKPVRGEISARMTGHTENIALLRKMAECAKN